MDRLWTPSDFSDPSRAQKQRWPETAGDSPAWRPGRALKRCAAAACKLRNMPLPKTPLFDQAATSGGIPKFMAVSITAGVLAGLFIVEAAMCRVERRGECGCGPDLLPADPDAS